MYHNGIDLCDLHERTKSSRPMQLFISKVGYNINLFTNA